MGKLDFQFAGKTYQFAEDHRAGITEVLPWLFLGGEEDVDIPLYGKILKPEDISPFSMSVKPKVDIWIDFRNEMFQNRRIFVPAKVTYVSMPFRDGDLDAARRVLPLAKLMLDQIKQEGKKALITCHAGVSRSATLALWILAEERGDYDGAWWRMRNLRPHFAPDPAFEPLLKELRTRYDFTKGAESLG